MEKKLRVVSLGFPPLPCSVWGVGVETARFCFVSFSFLGSVKREVRRWLQGWRSNLVLPVSHDWPSILCLTAWGQFSSLPRSVTCSGSSGCLPFAVFPHARDQCRGSPWKHSTGCSCPLLRDPGPRWGSSSPLLELHSPSLFSLFPNHSMLAAFCVITSGNLCPLFVFLGCQYLVVNFFVKFSVKIEGHGFCVLTRT